MPADAPDIIRDYREWIRTGASSKRNADEIAKIFEKLGHLIDRIEQLEQMVNPPLTLPQVVLGEDQQHSKP